MPWCRNFSWAKCIEKCYKIIDTNQLMKLNKDLTKGLESKVQSKCCPNAQ